MRGGTMDGHWHLSLMYTYTYINVQAFQCLSNVLDKLNLVFGLDRHFK